MSDVKGLIEARKKDLLALAQKRNIDVKDVLNAVGKDDRRQLALLASTLGIDARLALNLNHPLPIHEE